MAVPTQATREELGELVALARLTREEIAAEAKLSAVYIGLQLSGRRPLTDEVVRAAETLAARRTAALFERLLTGLQDRPARAGLA